MKLSATALCTFLVICCTEGVVGASFATTLGPNGVKHSLNSLADSKARSAGIGNVKLADDYCNSRCVQRFNYCQYSGGSADHCIRQFVHCRANC
jgi:hypothetical protein